MNKHFKALVSALVLLAMLAGMAAFAECAHTEKKQVTVVQDPVYTSEGYTGHKVTVDSMIYWECTKCGERFSGKPGESTSKTEAHDMKDGKCTKCGFTIQNKALDKVKSNGTITLSVGDQMQLSPSFATSQGLVIQEYKSSKPAIASVTATGLVTALAEGKAKITVIASNRKKATLTIKVVDPYKATGVKIAQGKSASVTVGETLRLTAQLTPVTARTTLTWTSSKPGVATVDANGVVTPLTEGKTKITVCTANKKKARITVRVVDPNKPTGVTLSQTGTVTLTMGQTLALSAALTPASAKSALSWTSSKAKVATVDANGVVTPHAEGTAKITVRTANKKKATVRVKVVDPFKPTGVSVAQGATVTIKAGQKLQLSAVLAPTTAKSALTWTSRKANIATVDANGLVTAVATGKTKITVRTANKKKATVTVIVTP